MKRSSEPSVHESKLILHDRPADVPELDLPDAPDFISRRTILPLAQALSILEERRQMFPQQHAAARARRRQPVPAEFVL